MDPHCNQHRLFNFPNIGLHRQTNEVFVDGNEKATKGTSFHAGVEASDPQFGDPYESRTRVCGVRGRRLNHLTNGPCRRSKLRIFRFHLTAKTPSLRCFSSSNQTRLRWALIGVLRTFWGSCITHPSGSGTPSGTRTLDTLIKSQVLYQLS